MKSKILLRILKNTLKCLLEFHFFSFDFYFSAKRNPYTCLNIYWNVISFDMSTYMYWKNIYCIGFLIYPQKINFQKNFKRLERNAKMSFARFWNFWIICTWNSLDKANNLHAYNGTPIKDGFDTMIPHFHKTSSYSGA